MVNALPNRSPIDRCGRGLKSLAEHRLSLRDKESLPNTLAIIINPRGHHYPKPGRPSAPLWPYRPSRGTEAPAPISDARLIPPSLAGLFGVIGDLSPGGAERPLAITTNPTVGET